MTVEKLVQIRDEAKKKLAIRVSKHDAYTILVSSGDVGIENGSRTVLAQLLDVVAVRGLENIKIIQNDNCDDANLCVLVEVIDPSGNRFKYVNVDAEIAKRIIEEHVCLGKVLEDALLKNK